MPQLGDEVGLDVLAVHPGGAGTDRLPDRRRSTRLRLLHQPEGQPVTGGLPLLRRIASAGKARTQSLQLGFRVRLRGEPSALDLSAPRPALGQREDQVPRAVSPAAQSWTGRTELSAVLVAAATPAEGRSVHYSPCGARPGSGRWWRHVILRRLSDTEQRQQRRRGHPDQPAAAKQRCRPLSTTNHLVRAGPADTEDLARRGHIDDRRKLT